MYAFVGSRTLNDTGGVWNGVGKGIYSLWFDNGVEAPPVLVDTIEVQDPLWLVIAASKRVLYAASHTVRFEGKPGAGITAYKIEQDGRLTPFSKFRVPHPHITMISIDADERFLLAASSGGGAISIVPLAEDGSLQPVSDYATVKGEPSVRVGEMPEPQHYGKYGFTITTLQPPANGTLPHFAEVTPDGKWVLVSDMLANSVCVYGIDTEKLKFGSVRQFPMARMGAGPRLMIQHPNGQTLYQVNQLDSSVSVFRFDTDKGIVEEIQHLPSHDPSRKDVSVPSVPCLDRKGRCLWTVNREHDSISTFSIQSGGELNFVAAVPAEGVYPMDIAQSPDCRYLFVSNVFSQHVSIFEIEESSGIPRYRTKLEYPGIFTLFWDGSRSFR